MWYDNTDVTNHVFKVNIECCLSEMTVWVGEQGKKLFIAIHTLYWNELEVRQLAQFSTLTQLNQRTLAHKQTLSNRIQQGFI